MAKSIVFLMSIPFTEHYAKRYGLRILEDKGIDTYIIDLSRLVNRELFREDEGYQFKGTRVFRVNSYSEFENKIKEFSKKSIFAEFLVSFSGIDIKHEKIFRILKKHHSKYYVIHEADLPSPFIKNGSKNNFLLKYLKIFNARSIGSCITKMILRLLIKFRFYPLPVKIFGTNSENMKNYMRKYDDGTITHIPINSSDYSNYLDYVKNNKEASSNIEKVCIFLDEDAAYSYDFDILKRRKIDGQRYFSAMNRLFNKIEEETGLEVIIAAHPRSHYEQYPNAFGKRKIIKDKTVELVAKSSLVIMHSSTAVSYPVLFQKPILVVKTENMIQTQSDVFVDAFARELGLEVVNIDDKQQLEGLGRIIKNSENNSYNAYKYKYLVSEGVEHLSTWDIIAEELSKDLGRFAKEEH